MVPSGKIVNAQAVTATPETLSRFQQRLPQMIDELAALTDIESPSESFGALKTCANYLASLGTSLLGQAPERIEADGRVHLLWRFGDTPKIVLVGHYDTVHPLGTAETFCFSRDGDIITGPGVCDMKAGVIIALHALHDLISRHGAGALDGVCLFLNADEEIGSTSSYPSIVELAKTAQAALCFENAGPVGEVKTERRGRSEYEVRVTGRAAHAGQDAADGINALEELCAQYDGVAALADEGAGTSVNPTTARAGTTTNTIPDSASMWVDVRCTSPEEQERVDSSIRRLTSVRGRARVEVAGEIQAPPMPASASAQLFTVAHSAWEGLGLGALPSMAVGGSADACRFAAHGVDAIDGLGAVGGGDHTETEWIYASSMSTHAALAAAMVAQLVAVDI